MFLSHKLRGACKLQGYLQFGATLKRLEDAADEEALDEIVRLMELLKSAALKFQRGEKSTADVETSAATTTSLT